MTRAECFGLQVSVVDRKALSNRFRPSSVDRARHPAAMDLFLHDRLLGYVSQYFFFYEQ